MMITVDMHLENAVKAQFGPKMKHYEYSFIKDLKVVYYQTTFIILHIVMFNTEVNWC